MSNKGTRKQPRLNSAVVHDSELLERAEVEVKRGLHRKQPFDKSFLELTQSQFHAPPSPKASAGNARRAGTTSSPNLGALKQELAKRNREVHVRFELLANMQRQLSTEVQTALSQSSKLKAVKVDEQDEGDEKHSEASNLDFMQDYRQARDMLAAFGQSKFPMDPDFNSECDRISQLIISKSAHAAETILHAISTSAGDGQADDPTSVHLFSTIRDILQIDFADGSQCENDPVVSSFVAVARSQFDRDQLASLDPPDMQLGAMTICSVEGNDAQPMVEWTNISEFDQPTGNLFAQEQKSFEFTFAEDLSIDEVDHRATHEQTVAKTCADDHTTEEQTVAAISLGARSSENSSLPSLVETAMKIARQIPHETFPPSQGLERVSGLCRTIMKLPMKLRKPESLLLSAQHSQTRNKRMNSLDVGEESTTMFMAPYNFGSVSKGKIYDSLLGEFDHLLCWIGSSNHSNSLAQFKNQFSNSMLSAIVPSKIPKARVALKKHNVNPFATYADNADSIAETTIHFEIFGDNDCEEQPKFAVDTTALLEPKFAWDETEHEDSEAVQASHDIHTPTMTFGEMGAFLMEHIKNGTIRSLDNVCSRIGKDTSAQAVFLAILTLAHQNNLSDDAAHLGMIELKEQSGTVSIEVTRTAVEYIR